MDSQEAINGVRPYFLPENVDFHALSQNVRAVLQAIVQPAYDELVLEADSPLEKSAGVSLAFLLTLEVLEQLAMMPQLDLKAHSGEASESRDQAVARYLRLINAKQKVSGFLLKLRQLRTKDMLAAATELG